MKKLMIIFACMVLISLIACGKAEQETRESDAPVQNQETEKLKSEDTENTENTETQENGEEENGIFTEKFTGNAEEHESNNGESILYWFAPEGFTQESDGMWYAPDYPNDTSNINIMENQDDSVTFQYTKDSFCEAVEYLYEQTYGYEVDVNCTEFLKSDMNGYNTLTIRASYTLAGTEIEQIQFAVETEKNKVTTITYTQIEGGKWTDAFSLCIESARIEKLNLENTEAEQPQFEAEIKFREIDWGSTFSDVDNLLNELNLWNISGELYKTYSVDDILIGDYEGIDFDYSGINVISNARNGEQGVAGYKTSEISLYFSYVPTDGYLTYIEDDSVLYGAQYKFEPTDLEQMREDLVKKLTELYGDPQKTSSDTDFWGNKYTYTYWYGANDTELVLRSMDSSEDTSGIYDDEIYISYAWRYGDTLLQQASDAVKKERLDEEHRAQESEDNSGL